MAKLKHTSKSKLAESDVYERYCQDTSSKQQVPQADFASELEKALALVDITLRQTKADGAQTFRGISWIEVRYLSSINV